MLRYAFIFLSVCAMGLFIALAGGAEWGTPEAGFIALGTFCAAMIITGAALEADHLKKGR